MLVCENCGKPATMLKVTPRGESPTCDTCKPADWGGEARAIVDKLPDLAGRKALSKAEAAASIGVSVDYFAERVMPELRTISRGGRVLIPVDELDAWVAGSAARALKPR